MLTTAEVMALLFFILFILWGLTKWLGRGES
jgi:hypothetical protein